MAPGITSTPEELLDLARLGQKLKPRERQAVVTWLESAGKLEEVGELQLAQIFKCSPASIRNYVRKARQGFATAITAEDAMGYMVNFLRSSDTLIKECKRMLEDKQIHGTGMHLGYMRMLKEVEAEKIEKLQSIGVIPKELGRLTAIEEHWEARVSPKGVTSVHELEDGSESA